MYFWCTFFRNRHSGKGFKHFPVFFFLPVEVWGGLPTLSAGKKAQYLLKLLIFAVVFLILSRMESSALA